MKKYIYLFIMLQNYFIFSQGNSKPVKFDTKKTAKLFYYNINEVKEKVKVKKDIVLKQTNKALREYNDKIKNISFLNFNKIKELDLLVNSSQKLVRSNPDLRLKIRKQINETVYPIRDSIKVNEDKLNNKLKNILSSKQYKRWLKHQKKIKSKLLPQKPERRGVQRSRVPLEHRRRRF